MPHVVDDVFRNVIVRLVVAVEAGKFNERPERLGIAPRTDQ